MLASPEGHRQTEARSLVVLDSLLDMFRRSQAGQLCPCDLPSAFPFCSGENEGRKQEALPLELVV